MAGWQFARLLAGFTSRRKIIGWRKTRVDEDTTPDSCWTGAILTLLLASENQLYPGLANADCAG
jgi:hypothetical protein